MNARTIQRVLDGRTPEEFERVYGPAAADKLFGPRYGVKPRQPIPMMLRIEVSRHV